MTSVCISMVSVCVVSCFLPSRSLFGACEDNCQCSRMPAGCRDRVNNIIAGSVDEEGMGRKNKIEKKYGECSQEGAWGEEFPRTMKRGTWPGIF